MWIKVILVVAFVAILLQRFYSQEDLGTVWQQMMATWSAGHLWLLLPAILLMPANWIVEMMKWRMLMRPAVMLSWRRAAAGILSGITFSLFTPNRIGEYGGRILFVDARHNWHAVVASLTGSFAQNLVHITAGCIAVIVMLSFAEWMPEVAGKGLMVLLVLATGVLWMMYLHLPAVVRFFQRWQPPRFLQNMWNSLEHVATMRRATLLRAVSLALMRYVIFCMQYMLILRFCGVALPWEMLAAGVAVIFLVQTSIPLPPVVDMMARNEIGILLWAGAGAVELHIIAAGLAVWILNLALPALFGLVAITSVNVLRSLGYENLPHIRPVLRRSDAHNKSA